MRVAWLASLRVFSVSVVLGVAHGMPTVPHGSENGFSEFGVSGFRAFRGSIFRILRLQDFAVSEFGICVCELVRASSQSRLVWCWGRGFRTKPLLQNPFDNPYLRIFTNSDERF